MFREMRRKDRALTNEESLNLLEKGDYGILSSVGEDGYAYGVPLNYVLDKGHIYFHCFIKNGHKLDNFKFNNKVSFCVVGKTKIIAEEFSTDFESVVAFGKISEVLGEDKISPLKKILQKYSPGFEKEGHKYIDADINKTGVYQIELENVTGKAKR